MRFLVYVYYPLLAVLLLKGAKLYKKGEWNQAFLSQEQMKAIQGFCAIGIMFHHMAQKTCAPWLNEKYIIHGLDVFVPIGYLLVAVFFFCSGYGLYKSQREKENYLSEFGWRRVTPILIAFFVTSAICLGVRTKMGEHLLENWTGSLLQFGEPQMFNQYGWFVYALLVVYLGFWLGFRRIKNEGVAIVVFGLVLAAYVYFCDWWLYGGWWYNTIPVALVGVLFAKYEAMLVPWMKRRYPLFMVLSFCFFAAVFAFAQAKEGELYVAWIQMAAAVLFVICLLVIGMKLQVGNKILAFIGGFTLEIYLIHGLFVQLFGYCFVEEGLKPLWYIKNVALYVLVVISLAIPIAYGLQRLHKLIYRFFNWRKELVIDVVRWTITILLGILVIVFVIAVYLGFVSRKTANEQAHLVDEYAKKHITYVDVDGKKMAAYVTGEGSHTIVILGGAEDACPTISFMPLASFLSSDCKVIVLDQFGRGFSDDTTQKRDADHIVDEIHQAISKLGVEKPYILMPHSNTGIYAQQYINTYPDEVEALIGIDAWIPDQYKEMLRVSNQTEKAFKKIQGKSNNVTYYLFKFGEPVCGLSRSIWYTMERSHGYLNEEELPVIEEITTQRYANRNAIDEAQYYYDDSKPMFGQKYEEDFPVLCLLAYYSEKYVYRDLHWEELHKNMFTNPAIQTTEVIEGDSYFGYYKCSKIKKSVLRFLEEIDAGSPKPQAE